MSLNFSAAHSSRITKRPRRDIHAVLKRSSSTPFGHFKRTKPVQRSLSQVKASDDDEDFFEDRLDDRGLVDSLATDPSLRDVPLNIKYIQSYMFDPVPEKGGMNSTRIAEILNFRKSLPPMITVSHVHALIRSPTEVEREVAELTKAGVLRKTMIPGRGTGRSSVSDGLVLLNDLELLLRETDGLEEAVKGFFTRIFFIADFFLLIVGAIRPFLAMSKRSSNGSDIFYRKIFGRGSDCFNASRVPNIFFHLFGVSERICQFSPGFFRNHDVPCQYFPSSFWICSSRGRRRRHPWGRKHGERWHYY